MSTSPNKHAEAIIKRGSRKEHDEGHSSAWKVAFADFCLALMCLFLVLWLMSSVKQEQSQQAAQMGISAGSLHADGSGHISDSPGGPRGSLIERFPMSRGDGSFSLEGREKPLTRYDTAAEMEELSRILIRMSEKEGLADNLQTVITPYGLRVMLHDTEKMGIFERGSANPSERFRHLLRKIGPLFEEIENQMVITGHTDSSQYVDRGHLAFSNWTLSSNRALAARSQLMTGGMPSRSILQVVGMADRAPLDDTNSAAGINRRIELLILSTSQAKSIAAMFGAPDRVVPLIDGVNSAVMDNAKNGASDAQGQFRFDKLRP